MDEPNLLASFLQAAASEDYYVPSCLQLSSSNLVFSLCYGTPTEIEQENLSKDNYLDDDAYYNSDMDLNYTSYRMSSSELYDNKMVERLNGCYCQQDGMLVATKCQSLFPDMGIFESKLRLDYDELCDHENGIKNLPLEQVLDELTDWVENESDCDYADEDFNFEELVEKVYCEKFANESS